MSWQRPCEVYTLTDFRWTGCRFIMVQDWPFALVPYFTQGDQA